PALHVVGVDFARPGHLRNRFAGPNPANRCELEFPRELPPHDHRSSPFRCILRVDCVSQNWGPLHTFLIEPGEHQVYAIRLDERWETHPLLPKTDETPITLKAIYEVPPTPEAA